MAVMSSEKNDKAAARRHKHRQKKPAAENDAYAQNNNASIDTLLAEDSRFKYYVDKAIDRYFKALERHQPTLPHSKPQKPYINANQPPLIVYNCAPPLPKMPTVRTNDDFGEPTESTQRSPVVSVLPRKPKPTIVDPALLPLFTPPKQTPRDAHELDMSFPPSSEGSVENCGPMGEMLRFKPVPAEVYKRRKHNFDYTLRLVTSFIILSLKLAYKAVAIIGEVGCRYPTYASIFALCFAAYFAVELVEFSMMNLLELTTQVMWPIAYATMRSSEYVLRGSGQAFSHLDSVYRGLRCDLVRIWCTRFQMRCDQRCSFTDSALNHMAY